VHQRNNVDFPLVEFQNQVFKSKTNQLIIIFLKTKSGPFISFLFLFQFFVTKCFE
jgi:hypothetical protein